MADYHVQIGSKKSKK